MGLGSALHPAAGRSGGQSPRQPVAPPDGAIDPAGYSSTAAGREIDEVGLSVPPRSDTTNRVCAD